MQTRKHPDWIDIPIVTERLIIRRFEEKDLTTYLRFMTDDVSTRYLGLRPEQETEAGARALFASVVAAYDSGNPVNAYAIADSSSREYVGSCGFAPYAAGVAECYYCLNREHRGHGFATEAVTALLRALTAKVEVRAFCHPDNTAAHAVAKRSGMQHCGRARHRHSALDGEMFVAMRRDDRQRLPFSAAKKGFKLLREATLTENGSNLQESEFDE